MASSYTSSPRHGNEGDFDDNDILNFDEDMDLLDGLSDEDTEDASETEVVKREEEFTEIKEQMYQDKLAQLKKQLLQLKEGTLPEYIKKLKKIEQQYKERIRVNEIWLNYELDLVEKEYTREKKEAAKEFEERKIELKEQLILDLDDKKKHIDTERTIIELTGDSMDVKQVTTRKLRRRPNDPMPMPEKRRKASPAQLNYALSEDDINEDLKILNKVSGKPLNKKPAPIHTPMANKHDDNIYDARIEDGRLYYEKRWFHRGQAVFVESKDMGKVSAVISAVGTQEIWLRKTLDNCKLRIYVAQLQRGKYIVRRRTS